MQIKITVSYYFTVTKGVRKDRQKTNIVDEVQKLESLLFMLRM